MSGILKIVPTMKENPGCCIICACTPLDETKEGLPPLPSVHAEGLDVNWGDSVYICWNCAGIISDLIERPAKDKVDKVQKRVVFEKKRADKAEEKVEKLEKRIAAIIGGKKALAEAKAEAS